MTAREKVGFPKTSLALQVRFASACIATGSAPVSAPR